ncbi:MAG: hypothetical protein CMM47_02680 [Rhodospirillaceae bacterium]|nr:hypothetical protein [Rhodospirillaceae bacterium]
MVKFLGAAFLNHLHIGTQNQLMISLLANLTEHDIVDYPFPHIVKRNVLDKELFNDLINNFPKIENFPGFPNKSNIRLSFRYSNYLQSNVVSPTWEQFLKRNSDPEYLKHFLRVFERHIKLSHPHGHQFLKFLQHTKIGIQGIDSFSDTPILLQSSIDANTPNLNEPSSVRGPHLDKARSLWVGFLTEGWGRIKRWRFGALRTSP